MNIMCTNVRFITNRSLHYDLYKPVRIPIPCGHCEECAEQKRKEWFCRCYYEWQNSPDRTFYYTLTYNNEHLPIWHNVPHFSKRHLQLFLKKLRKKLSELGITLKYLITCELGELRGRPHYHLLFFLSKTINPYWLFRFIQDCWSVVNPVTKMSESLGFVKPGDNVGLVNSSSGIQYVTKYIIKDYAQIDAVMPELSKLLVDRYNNLFNYVISRWYPQYDYRSPIWFSEDDNVFHIVRVSGGADDYNELCKLFIKKVRSIANNLTPFHIQSTKLGVRMLEFCSRELDKVPVMNRRGDVKMYNLPRYMKRLLWYDVIEGENSGKKDTFVLSESGCIHVFERLQPQIDDAKQHYLDALVSCSSLDSVYLDDINLHCKTNFKTIRDLVYWCQHFDLDLDVMAIYSRVFRGRVCTFNIDDDFTMNADFFKQNWKQYAYNCLFETSEFDFGAIHKDSHLVSVLNGLMWNNLNYFHIYETSLQILEALVSCSRLSKNKARFSDEKDTRKLRQYYQCLT